MTRQLLLIAAALLLVPGCTTPGAGKTEATQKVVAIDAEPNHKIRFDNGRVRVYEVILAKGQATLVHEHRADSFAVIFGNAEFVNEPRGGEARTVKLPNGFVGFSPAAGKPYSHRAVASGDALFHVAVLELLGPSPAGASGTSRHPDLPFKVVRESPRGRAFRITLAPGATTPEYTRPPGSMLFAVSSGRLTEVLGQGRTRLWDMEPGSFHWFDAGETLSLRNEGPAAIDLVEIDVF